MKHNSALKIVLRYRLSWRQYAVRFTLSDLNAARAHVCDAIVSASHANYDRPSGAHARRFARLYNIRRALNSLIEQKNARK